MTGLDTLSERQEYLEGGLAQVCCARCGARVRARKASPHQTSVQWSTAAARVCAALAAYAGRGPTALIPTCPDLRDSIDSAVREGLLEVPQ